MNGTCLGLSSGTGFGAVFCCKERIQDSNKVLKLLVCEKLKLERQRKNPKINSALLKHSFNCLPSVSDHCDCPSTSYSGGVTELGHTNSWTSAVVAPGTEQFPHRTGNR